MSNKINQEITTEKEPAKKAKESKKTDLLIRLAQENIELSHTPNDESFASIKSNGHCENFLVDSKYCRKFLIRLYYKETGGYPGGQILKDAMDFLSAKALFDSPELALHLRYAEHEGAIYIDLGNDTWNQVCITKDGWAVIESKDSPVKFKRTQGMKAMPIPSKEGKIEDLRQFLNIENESDWVLIVAWLIGAMKPTGTYPILLQQLNIKNIIVAYDWDNAGKAGINKIAKDLDCTIYYLGGMKPDEDPADKLKNLQNITIGFSLKHLSNAARKIQKQTDKPVGISFLSSSSPKPSKEIIFKPDTTLDVSSMDPQRLRKAPEKYFYESSQVLAFTHL